MHEPARENDPPMCAFVRDRSSDAEILHVFGEVDLANASEFATAINGLAGNGSTFVVDLTGCTYMDSSGLRVLVTAHNAHGPKMRLAVPESGSVRRIFELTNLLTQFANFSSVEDAARSNGQPSSR